MKKRECWCCMDRDPKDYAKTRRVRIISFGKRLDGKQGVTGIMTAHLTEEEIAGHKDATVEYLS